MGGRDPTFAGSNHCDGPAAKPFLTATRHADVGHREIARPMLRSVIVNNDNVRLID